MISSLLAPRNGGLAKRWAQAATRKWKIDSNGNRISCGCPTGTERLWRQDMGRRLPKAELLKAIGQERSALDKTLAQLTARQMTRAGVTKGGWSVKDILAHLLEWQQMNLDWYAAGLRGETVYIPAKGYTLRDLPRLNQMIYRKHHRRSLKSVIEDFEEHHNKTIALIDSLSDADLTSLGRYSWTGPSWTLSDYLRASTAAHYLWARQLIQRWIRREVRWRNGAAK